MEQVARVVRFWSFGGADIVAELEVCAKGEGRFLWITDGPVRAYLNIDKIIDAVCWLPFDVGIIRVILLVLAGP